MRDVRLLHILAATVLLLAAGPAAAAPVTPDGPAKAVAIDDFGYLDTSAEPADQTAVHHMRLQAFMAALRGDVSAHSRFRLIPSSCASTCINDGRVLADRLRAASQAGVTVLIVGNIRKMSTLVQWARAAAIDTASNRILFEKLFSFRGDNDEAWQRAEAFVSEELCASLAGAPASSGPVAALAPVRLAVFPFELDDTSAGAEITGETASDASGLADTTDAIRQLLAQSGRYQIVDVSTADAAKAHALHDCSGCEAQAASGLGADQSLLGVIRRVSRTEYTVRFQIRDTSSGAIVAGAESSLRMGANYSSSRGAARLIRERLLEGGQQ